MLPPLPLFSRASVESEVETLSLENTKTITKSAAEVEGEWPYQASQRLPKIASFGVNPSTSEANSVPETESFQEFHETKSRNYPYT